MEKLGMDAKLYRNKGTYAVPDWEEITNVRDVTLNLEEGEADLTTRANAGWRATLGTLKDASVDFEWSGTPRMMGSPPSRRRSLIRRPWR